MFFSHKYHDKQLLTAAVYYDIGKKVNQCFLWANFLKSVYIVFHVTPMMITFNIVITGLV